jgi:catechol 2,3-dioxygenase-like lactoylglutathione lyase family enzyme
VITSTHAVLYAAEPERAREFFRDVLDLPFVDVHGGWLIFALPPAELGVHPAGEPGQPTSGAPSGHHELFFMCDNIETTVAELTAKGVEFTAPIEQQRFGRLTRLRVPGAGEIGLYQPSHPTAYDLGR